MFLAMGETHPARKETNMRFSFFAALAKVVVLAILASVTTSAAAMPLPHPERGTTKQVVPQPGELKLAMLETPAPAPLVSAVLEPKLRQQVALTVPPAPKPAVVPPTSAQLALALMPPAKPPVPHFPVEVLFDPETGRAELRLLHGLTAKELVRLDNPEVLCLAYTLYKEAKQRREDGSMDVEAILSVGEAIHNRMANPAHPGTTACAVAEAPRTQDSTGRVFCQFEGVETGSACLANLHPADFRRVGVGLDMEAYLVNAVVATAIIANGKPLTNLVGKATFFHVGYDVPRNKDSWWLSSVMAGKLQPVACVGGHIFYELTNLGPQREIKLPASCERARQWAMAARKGGHGNG